MNSVRRRGVDDARTLNDIGKFIHLFIYIAPLQGYYSEALQFLARLNRIVFRLE